MTRIEISAAVDLPFGSFAALLTLAPIVIPAKAGIHFQIFRKNNKQSHYVISMDSRVGGNDERFAFVFIEYPPSYAITGGRAPYRSARV
ncbi:MAG: hypothetical protein LBF86_09465 [Helicobacteraceae bacterium]|jgi:hypothetical protein|nr:hypothetical protein [Helicobacteraceae bacterium]